MKLQAEYPPGFSGNILVHAKDNGRLVQIPEGPTIIRALDAVILNILRPPRKMTYVCEKCEMVFANSAIAFKVEESLSRRIATGELVYRHYTQPAARPYTP